jgi:hypothetical protein
LFGEYLSKVLLQPLSLQVFANEHQGHPTIMAAAVRCRQGVGVVGVLHTLDHHLLLLHKASGLCGSGLHGFVDPEKEEIELVPTSDQNVAKNCL